MKLLDCTIRDGGYYTNWDFDNDLIVEYASLMESLPIEYIEVGYRSITLEGYLGKYYYCPVYVLEELKCLMPSKKLVIILNEKDIRVEHLEELLLPIKPLVTLIRMAVDPKNFGRAIILAKAVKAMGFEVAFNVMYMSNWKNDPSFLNLLDELENTLDFFYMVDSFGGILPNEVKEIIKLVQSKTKVPLGFHGHDNLSMGLINSITAMEEGCEIIDSTITGMGRGAGNLKTELLLTYLESQNKIKLNFNLLTQVVDNFSLMQKKYGWGSTLPYMVSGAYSLPQKDVMSWVTNGKYSFNTIIRALKNLTKGIKDNENFKLLNEDLKQDSVILIGGGPSIRKHFDAITQFINSNKSVVLVHASSKHSNLFKEFSNKQYFCLVGNEGYRMENVFEGNYLPLKMCKRKILSTEKSFYYCPNGDKFRSLEASENKDNAGKLIPVVLTKADGSTELRVHKVGRWYYEYADGDVYEGDFLNSLKLEIKFSCNVDFCKILVLGKYIFEDCMDDSGIVRIDFTVILSF